MKRTGSLFLATVFLLFGFSLSLRAEEFHNSISYQGFTGILNTPTAEVTENGRIYLEFSDQIESNRRVTPAGVEKTNAENYMFSVGVLPYFEFGGRFTEEYPDCSGCARDLSVNAKFQIPFPEKWDHLPRFAFGMQDIGGGSSHFETVYGVVTKDIWRLRFSGGYGGGPDRMDGLFGGAEFKIFDWMYALGDYDADETHVGIRLVTPDNLFNFPVNIGLTGKSSVDNDFEEFDFAFTLQIPLGFDHRYTKAIPAKYLVESEAGKDEKPGENKLPERRAGRKLPQKKKEAQNQDGVDEKLKSLKNEIIEFGFENVRLGIEKPETLYIEYENNRFNHNQLDGLGLLLGVAARGAPENVEDMRVILKVNHIPVLEVRTNVHDLRYFMINPEITDNFMQQFKNRLKVSRKIGADKQEPIRFIGGSKNYSFFKPRLLVYPGLVTYVGTEWAAFDYLLSMKTEVQFPLWYGAVLNARWDIPLSWSDNFEEGMPWSRQKEDTELERLMLHQAFKLAPGLITQFSGGLYKRDYGGVINKTIWSPGSGRHRFKFIAGYFEDIEDEETRFLIPDELKNEYRDIILGAYQFYYEGLDVYLEAMYGKYWEQDEGVTLELKRFFGDTAFSLFYRQVGTESGEKSAGIGISIPLTPRRDMKPWYLQIKGLDRWEYEHQTTIAESGERNPINETIAIKPRTTINVEDTYMNAGRLNEIYVKTHLHRLRDAFYTWGVKE